MNDPYQFLDDAITVLQCLLLQVSSSEQRLVDTGKRKDFTQTKFGKIIELTFLMAFHHLQNGQ